MPTQPRASRISMIRAKAAIVLANPSWARQPTARPHRTIMPVVTTLIRRSAPDCPNGIAQRAIGIERNRSITPRWTSAAIIITLAITPAKVAIANRPGIRYSR
jgi:hypothetical protein